ncbi:MAG TPA: hypothetical protein PKH42_09550 [Sedimentibacter sp.]|nr:hypothetical protein [Sedimentibacter sp.]HOG63584.1 hypothetical protein [Sedimentibacter sp.]
MAVILSIDIDNNIKIIEASKKGETLSVLRCMTIESSGAKDGKIIDMDGIVNVINEEFKNNGIKTRKAIFVINSSKIMIRKIKLPLLKKSPEILSMLQIELQQIVSVDLSKYKIVYEISNATNENRIPYAEYIVYCVPVILVSECVELAAKLKLKLLKIDISHNCINSLYKNNIKINDVGLNNGENAAFISVNKNFISFSTAHNGFCDFHISSDLEEIVAQLTKFMRYYYSVSGNRSIEKIYIYGNNNHMLKEVIKTKLDLNSEIIESISGLSAETLPDGFELSKYLNNVLTLFSNNKEQALNKSCSSKLKNNYGYAAILLVIAAASTVMMGFFNSRAAMKNELTAMNAFIHDGKNNEIYSVIEEIKNETDYLKFYLQQAQELKAAAAANDYVDTNILREVYRIKPFETRVTSIYSGRDSTQLLCLSPSMSEAALFFSDLKEIEQVKSAYMPAVQSKSGEPFSYSIVLKLKEVSSEE